MNEGQATAFQEMLDFITSKDKDHYMWVLKGYAGTGKTFTVTQLVDALDALTKTSNGFGESYHIAMSAPTHKAVRVMKKFSTFGAKLHFATIHSLLGLREEIDERTGKQKFVQSKDPQELRIEQFNVVLLDEASMVPDEIFVLLIPYVRKGLKLVFIGDPVQIPPVNHKDSMPFKPDVQEKYKIGVSELKQIMRQAGENPILRLATTIRMGYKTVPHFLMESDVKGSMLEHRDATGIAMVDHSGDDDLEKIIEAYFVTPEFNADPDYMKIIAWRNKTVSEFNGRVRMRIYKQDGVLPFIMEGEKLIIDKPVILPESQRILLSTNEEVTVRNYEIKTINLAYTTAEPGNRQMIEKDIALKYYNTWVNYFDQYNRQAVANIRILHESEQVIFRNLIDGIVAAALAAQPGPNKTRLWKSKFGTEKLFAQVKYNYAITGHKSQGSTYDNVLMLDWDIAMNQTIEERNRIRYVGVTRARNLLFIQK